MSALYKLNKDELIQIILAVKESMSIEDLRTELKRKEELEKLNQLKRALLNLKVVPHLRKYIAKNENFIKNETNIDNIIEISDLEILRITEISPSLYYDVKYNESNKIWTKGDKIVYQSCKSCSDFEVLVYKNEILLSKYSSNSYDSVCLECQI